MKRYRMLVSGYWMKKGMGFHVYPASSIQQPASLRYKLYRFSTTIKRVGLKHWLRYLFIS